MTGTGRSSLGDFRDNSADYRPVYIELDSQGFTMAVSVKSKLSRRFHNTISRDIPTSGWENTTQTTHIPTVRAD